MKIGETIRKLRLERGATLEDIALAAGTDASNLSRIERGRQRFTPELLAGIAEALQVSLSTLYTRAEQEMAEYVVNRSENTENPASTPGYNDLLSRYGRLSPENQRLTLEFVKLLARQQRMGKTGDKETP